MDCFPVTAVCEYDIRRWEQSWPECGSQEWPCLKAELYVYVQLHSWAKVGRSTQYSTPGESKGEWHQTFRVSLVGDVYQEVLPKEAEGRVLVSPCPHTTSNISVSLGGDITCLCLSPH